MNLLHHLWDNKEKFGFYLFVIFTIIFSIIIFRIPLILAGDSTAYLSAADNIAKGLGFYSFNMFFSGSDNVFTPITNFQPSYSFLISILIWMFEMNTIMAARIINFIFWAIYLASWIATFKLIFSKKSMYFITACIFLLFYWSYAIAALSESVFVGFLGLLAYSLTRAYKYPEKNISFEPGETKKK